MCVYYIYIWPSTNFRCLRPARPSFSVFATLSIPNRAAPGQVYVRVSLVLSLPLSRSLCLYLCLSLSVCMSATITLETCTYLYTYSGYSVDNTAETSVVVV